MKENFTMRISGSQRGIRCSMFLILLGLSTLAFGLSPSSAAQNTNGAPGRTDYSNFEIIPKKNIFNPRRSPAYVPRERPGVYRRTESFALVGVMSYGKGPMAFFDGTRSDYKKVLKPDDKIGGFKVTAIEPSSVKLASSTNEIAVQVGMQMTREDGGEWKLSVRPESLESVAHDEPMRSALAVNAERASSATNQNGNNPFGAIGNFFANGGGFNPGGFGNAPGAPQPQPTVAPTPTQATPVTDPNEMLRILAERRRQQTGDPDPQSQPPNQGGEPRSDQRGPSQPNQQPLPDQPVEQSPNPRGEPPPNQ